MDARDRATGLLATAAGLGVFWLFLLLAVHTVLGLYATTIASAQAHDAATAVARAGPDQLAAHPAVGSARLSDLDGDGQADSVTVDLTIDLPSLGPYLERRITRSATARLERPR